MYVLNVLTVNLLILLTVASSPQRQQRNPCWSSGCSHSCELNSNRQPVCHCPEYLTLSADSKHCVRDQQKTFLLVANNRSIKEVLVKTDKKLHIGDIKIPNNLSISDITYQWRSDTIFFVTERKDIVYSINNSTTNSIVTPQLTATNSTFGCITFDEFTGNIFWLNKNDGTLNVANLDNKYNATIITKLEDAVSFVLNPLKKTAYIAIHGRNPKILETSLTGAMRRPVTNGNFGPAAVLFLSIKEQRLYFVTKYSKSIWSYDLNKTHRLRTLRLGEINSDVASLVVWNEKLVWTVVSDDKLYFGLNVVTNLPEEWLSLNGTNASKILAITPPKNISSNCSLNNNGCSHICLPGKCICPAGSLLLADEKTCEVVRQCHEFRCADGVGCVADYFVCDGHADCDDASDERGCVSTCQSDEYQCKSGQCIHKSFRCDSTPDCTDGSDEFQCLQNGCHENQFDCGDGECFFSSAHCNGIVDCSNGNDEKGCRFCQNDTSMWHCRTGVCIPKLWLCDGKNDCEDASDEENCKLDCEHSCGNNYCVNYTQVCDDVVDCKDGSDEVACPPKAYNVSSTSVPPKPPKRVKLSEVDNDSATIVIVVLFFLSTSIIVACAVFRNKQCLQFNRSNNVTVNVEMQCNPNYV